MSSHELHCAANARAQSSCRNCGKLQKDGVSGAVHSELYTSLMKRQVDEQRKCRRQEVEKHPYERTNSFF